MRKTSILVVLTALLFVGCSSDSNNLENNKFDNKLNKKTNTIDSLPIEDAIILFGHQFEPIKGDIVILSGQYNYGSISLEEYKNESEVLLTSLYPESHQLLTSYGFTESDFQEMFENENGSILTENQKQNIVTHVAITGYLLNQGQHPPLSDDPNIIIYSDPWSGTRVGPCILEALGAEALVDLWKGRALSSVATRRVLLKAVGKTAAKVGLGAIGTAVAVADFVWCMGRE